MLKKSKETPQPPSYPGSIYVRGLFAMARDERITIDEAAAQTVEKLRVGFAEEHIEPTRQALRWIKANPSIE